MSVNRYTSVDMCVYSDLSEKCVRCVSVNRYNSVDMCVAVAIEAGLITPIVFNADRKVGISVYVLILFVTLFRDFLIDLLSVIELSMIGIPCRHNVLIAVHSEYF